MFIVLCYNHYNTKKGVSVLSNYHFYKSESIEFITINNTNVNFSEHCHTTDFVITLLLKGNAILTKGMTQICICSNDTFTIAPYETHALTSNDNASLLSMCIKKQAVYDFSEDRFQKCVFYALMEISRAINFNVKYFNVFAMTALGIYREYHRNYKTELNYFEISRNKLEQYPERSDTIEQLADEIFISKYHYIRKFKEISGLTPHKFQIQSRVRKAQQLLICGNSITDIALNMGFYDQSHFDKYFRKIVGIAPTDYVCSVSNFLQAKK